jgi:hypothetical protein
VFVASAFRQRFKTTVVDRVGDAVANKVDTESLRFLGRRWHSNQGEKQAETQHGVSP